MNYNSTKEKLKKIASAIFFLPFGFAVAIVIVLWIAYKVITDVYKEFRFHSFNVLQNFEFWIIFISSAFAIGWIVSIIIDKVKKPK
jgi:hypothetical protein